MIDNMEFSLCDFINNINNMKEYFDTYRIKKIINRSEINQDEDFFKWETYMHDSDEGICPDYCFNCHVHENDEENYTCNKITLKYFVKQWTVGMELDSYQGILVYPLKDHYIFVDYSC